MKSLPHRRISISHRRKVHKKSRIKKKSARYPKSGFSTSIQRPDFLPSPLSYKSEFVQSQLLANKRFNKYRQKTISKWLFNNKKSRRQHQKSYRRKSHSQKLRIK